MHNPPHLPIGNASFEVLRQAGQLYVDKTRHIFKMVDSGIYYFISRPRRFGKSLTVSTLKSLFEGRKELFDGLWIAEQTDWEWQVHPVITLDFNEIPHERPEVFKQALSFYLKQTAEEYGIAIQTDFIETRFQQLILSLKEKFNRSVAILIDEYDKPIISHLGKGRAALEIAKQNREILKHFFGVLKGARVSPCLRFVFVTGVSKFSRVSIFSELNNLKDLTMNRHYAEMLGYTQAELESCFIPYVQRFARECGQESAWVLERLKGRYNGYRFTEKDIQVYNPFSVLSALDEMAFKNYWFETGTPGFLVNLLAEKQWYLPAIEAMQATEAVFSVFDLDHLKPEALLFQTGYITIKDVRGRLYTFDYPNQEVKTAFLENLFPSTPAGSGI